MRRVRMLGVLLIRWRWRWIERGSGVWVIRRVVRCLGSSRDRGSAASMGRRGRIRVGMRRVCVRRDWRRRRLIGWLLMLSVMFRREVAAI
jgi:hypothetical protein